MLHIVLFWRKGGGLSSGAFEPEHGAILCRGFIGPPVGGPSIKSDFDLLSLHGGPVLNGPVVMDNSFLIQR
jgi:hypothetical protein